MEQEQTPKDEGHKAGGSMPEQPERDPKTGALEGEELKTTPVEEPSAETKPAENTGDENPVCGDDLEQEEHQDDVAREEEEAKKEAEKSNAEAEAEGGERNE